MRPLRLELEGFTSFRERTEVSFEETDLFVFTGVDGIRQVQPDRRDGLSPSTVPFPRYDNLNV